MSHREKKNSKSAKALHEGKVPEFVLDWIWQLRQPYHTATDGVDADLKEERHRQAGCGGRRDPKPESDGVVVRCGGEKFFNLDVLAGEGEENVKKKRWGEKAEKGLMVADKGR